MSDDPARFGPYEIAGTLGRGGMGVVFDGRHTATGERVAIKTVRVPSEQFVSGVRREILTLAGIRHPGVVRILDHGVKEGLPWYAMERLDGRTFDTGLRSSRPRSWSEIGVSLAILRRVCATLAFLHGEGIVHRDLKPPNIVVRDTGDPVVIDFGIAARFAGKSNREAIGLASLSLGTLAYAAPEQLDGELVDARTDLYALGCILFECLTGAPPFACETAYDAYVSHLEEPPPVPSSINPDVPAPLDRIVLRLLEKRPAHRFGFAHDVGVALAHAGIEDPLGEPAFAPRPYLYRPSIAGRTGELSVLRQKLDDATASRGGVVLITGESGAGKTRLAMELVRLAPARSIRVIVGECTAPSLERRGSVPRSPFEPMRPALRTLADASRELGRFEAERILGPRARVLEVYEPTMAGIPGCDHYPDPVELPDSAARIRLFRAMASSLRNLATGRPVLFVIDDAQWADALTLGFLEFAASSSTFADAPVVIVATCRAEEIPPALESLQTSSAVSSVTIGRLGSDDVRQMLADMLALESAPEGLADFLADESEGNPFFVAEFLRAAVDDGHLSRNEDGRWTAGLENLADRDRLGQLGVPVSIREIVDRKLEHLSAEDRDVVEVASVVGRVVDQPVLARVLGFDEDGLLAACSRLVRRHVFEDSDGALRFSHDRMREAAYARLDGDRLVRLHRAVAVAFEELGRSDDPSVLAMLGRHWEIGGEVAKARACYLSGATDARTRYANADADPLYEAYFRLGGAGDEDDVAVRNEHGRCVFRLGRTGDALRIHEQALADAQRFGDLASEGRTLRMIGIVERETGDFESAVAHFDRALEIARGLGDGHDEMTTLGEMAICHSVNGRYEKAEAHFELVIRLAKARGDREALARHLGNLGLMHGTLGHRDAAHALYEESLNHAREIGDVRTEAITLINLGVLLGELGRLDEARAVGLRALELNRNMGNRVFEGSGLSDLAYIEGRLGNTEAARRLFDEGMVICQEVGSPYHVAGIYGYRAQLERRAGELDLAAELVDEAIRRFRELGNVVYEGIFTCERGLVAAANGEDPHPYLDDAERMYATGHAAPESEFARSLERLREACRARNPETPT